jgi:hypothetical protein
MNARHIQLIPSVRRKGIVVQALPTEVLVYELERHQAHCLNHTAALIWKHCDGQTSVTEMIRILEEEPQAPVPEAVVWLALHQLGKAHLLVERVDSSGDRGPWRTCRPHLDSRRRDESNALSPIQPEEQAVAAHLRRAHTSPPIITYNSMILWTCAASAPGMVRPSSGRLHSLGP